MSPWNANAASLIVDFYHLRCGNCKVQVSDRFAERCPTCGATFERVSSNHVGLADKLIQERSEHARASAKAAESATEPAEAASRPAGTVSA